MTIKHFPVMLRDLIDLEIELCEFYDLIQEAFRKESSQKFMQAMKENQMNHLEQLKTVDVEKYNKMEFIKNPPDIMKAHMLQKININADSTPEEILGKILIYEDKLLKIYEHLKSILVYQKTKDLIESFIQFKIMQIKEISGFSDDLFLAI